MHEPFQIDRSSRGRTRSLRLRALDAFVIALERQLLRREDGAWRGAPLVDVGLGDAPVTTVELARAVREVNGHLEVWGVDHAPARVEAAGAFAVPGVRFLTGDFDTLPTLGARARLIRVMNVLRGYPLEFVSHAHGRLGEALLEGGMALEGSCDPDGSVLCAHVLRRTGTELVREALLFHTDFSRGFAPWMFRDWLPRDLRRSVRPGSGIHGFLTAWTRHFEAHRSADPAESFRRTAEALSAADAGVPRDEALFARGMLRWAPPAGVPRD